MTDKLEEFKKCREKILNSGNKQITRFFALPILANESLDIQPLVQSI